MRLVISRRNYIGLLLANCMIFVSRCHVNRRQRYIIFLYSFMQFIQNDFDMLCDGYNYSMFTSGLDSGASFLFLPSLSFLSLLC